jgi:hypothetical protein
LLARSDLPIGHRDEFQITKYRRGGDKIAAAAHN